MPPQDAPALILAGPTASGKSAGALRLAEELGGVVINADSMQVYRELRILTARPSAEEEENVPHHLYGHVAGTERYSAGRFAADARLAVEEARAAGQVPIFCGGTGLYLRALTEGLSPIPDVPAEVTGALEERWAEDPAALRRELVASDPAMARLDPQDRQRHIRALAVLSFTKRALSSWQDEPTIPPLPGQRFLAACLIPERGKLYARCDARLLRMVEAGALEEVAALTALGLEPSLPMMKALGVAELAAHLAGEIGLEEAVALAQRQTRRYAKRQMTWFANQTSWPAFRLGEEIALSSFAPV